MKRLLIALLVINLVFLVAQQFSGPQQDTESGLPMEHEAGPTDITYQPNPLFQTTENVLESGVLEGGVTENSPEQERIESVESLPSPNLPLSALFWALSGMSERLWGGAEGSRQVC